MQMATELMTAWKTRICFVAAETVIFLSILTVMVSVTAGLNHYIVNSVIVTTEKVSATDSERGKS
jgi:hypothetical protein